MPNFFSDFPEKIISWGKSIGDSFSRIEQIADNKKLKKARKHKLLKEEAKKMLSPFLKLLLLIVIAFAIIFGVISLTSNIIHSIIAFTNNPNNWIIKAFIIITAVILFSGLLLNLWSKISGFTAPELPNTQSIAFEHAIASEILFESLRNCSSALGVYPPSHKEDIEPIGDISRNQRGVTIYKFTCEKTLEKVDTKKIRKYIEARIKQAHISNKMGNVEALIFNGRMTSGLLVMGVKETGDMFIDIEVAFTSKAAHSLYLSQKGGTTKRTSKPYDEDF